MTVLIPAEGVTLLGDLSVPEEAVGVVVFAHGSGSSRLSERNRMVARALNQQRIATLLFDLLTENEAGDRRNVFDIPLLAERLAAAIRWVRTDAGARGLPVGLFGASTGAAAALTAAASDDAIAAVVSRGGRPDMAEQVLGAVRAPTLLIVGGRDEQVLAWNEQAQRRLRCHNDLAVVPGATHLFEEPGALEQVARLAADWFAQAFARSE